MSLASRRHERAVRQLTREIAGAVRADAGFIPVIAKDCARLFVPMPIPGREELTEDDDLSNLAARHGAAIAIEQTNGMAVGALPDRQAVAVEDAALVEELPGDGSSLTRAYPIDEDGAVRGMTLERDEVTPKRWLAPETNQPQRRQSTVIVEAR